MTHSESSKWCLIDKGPDGIDLKWISSTGSIKWFSDLMPGPVSNLYAPKDGDSTSVMVSSVMDQKAFKMSIATYCVADDCGEHEDCFSELNSDMPQVEFIKTFRTIKETVFTEWEPTQSDVIRMPLEDVSSNRSNQKCKPSSQPDKRNTSPVPLKSPVKLFQSVAGSSRASRSPVKSKIIRNAKQKRQTQRRLNITTIGGTPVESPTEMEEEEEEDILVNLEPPAKRQQMSIQKSSGKSAKEMEEEETVQVNQAKRQRLSTPKSTNKRDFQDSVIAMREALVADMTEESYEELGDDQCLPGPSATVRAQWTNILQYKEYNKVCNNAREYKLVALLSKRCWTKVLHIFQLCQRNEIVTKERRAPFLLFSPLKRLSEAEKYSVLSTYAETTCKAKLDVKTLINSVKENMEMDKLPTTTEMVIEFRKLKRQLKGLEQQGITLEAVAQQRERIKELEAEVTQLQMFALSVAQTANSNEKPDVKIDNIKRLLEIDSYLDATTGGFAMELSLSKIEGHLSQQMTDEFSPGSSSTMLNDALDAMANEAFEDTEKVNLDEATSEGLDTEKVNLDEATSEGLDTEKVNLDEATSEGVVTDNKNLEATSEGVVTDNKNLDQDTLKGWVAVALGAPEGWHIAKVESVQGDTATVSFLQTGIPRVYKWPELKDKDVVNRKCIIDKNVEMVRSGTGTREYWRMSIATCQRLNKLFDAFKIKYW